MPETKNASELMAIQPTIIRFTQMLSTVLKVDAEVVDADLVRIAGTGPYSQFFGKKLNASSRLFRYIIETKEEKTLIKSQADPLCAECTTKDACRETAFLGVPILLEDRCIGVMSLVAFTEESQQTIKDNAKLFSDYIKHTAQLVVAKVTENQTPNKGLEDVFINLIDNMDQGVLVLDENNYVKYGNQPALANLNITIQELPEKKINIRPLSQCRGSNDHQQQHIVSIGRREELLVGQFYNCRTHKLFLMSFYQPHNPVLPYETNAVFAEVIGESAKMQKLKGLMSRISKSPSSVLINGESGTGKEVIANAVHKLSGRAQNPFIAINCAAIPDQLLESELFGYTKGAFTGASSKGRVGLIQAANNGTLFLDEIGDMSMQLQAKLLRVLEAREVMPIGSNKATPVDIRIISATNRNFAEMIATNKFREDLYYRLNVIPLQLPALREREGDVPLLVNHFMDIHTQKLGTNYPGMSEEAMSCLTSYHWPGNVRELSNLVEYLINIVPEGEQIDVDLLPPHFEAHQPEPKPSPIQDSGMSLEDMERVRIEEAIGRLGNRKLVAEELGIGIATLYRKLKKYGLNEKCYS
ncbi:MULTISPECIES: sigma 54-interacting transcriptional regulator [Vibrio]|nr:MULTISPECIES: sigma 54-interacting transcriptional regulator [Vibrio]EDL52459.1 putative transcriptional regulator [Vibrio mediterranei AK1]MDA0107719.1 sigma 54-interacting transcriptional regulator [Vibrio sp. La 4.2.2]USE03324.1 sigma 54-interacting transcriptional regulator [Vibrio sp. SCSIO 43133]